MNRTFSAPAPATDDRWARRAGVVLFLAVVLAWANSLQVPFMFDDDASIAANTTIRRLGSCDWLFPPSGRGETVSGRPVLNFTLALNYAVGGLDVRGYHVLNVGIHATAALLLFGLVRRTRQRVAPDAGADRATWLAFCVAGLWALHPVQTQAVTYVVQRGESLMALFYLATLYGFIRSLDAPSPTRWRLLSIAACWLGMATKENMVSAPVIVLLFDRAFCAGSFRQAWLERRGYYVALVSSWLLLVLLVASTGGNRGGTSGFDVGVSWIGYVLTQAPALVRYACLSFWPYPLIFEYGDFAATLSSVAFPLGLVLVAIGATVVALWRAPRVGVVAALGFAVLAPTSLVPGTLQMIVEYRMYLPLASVIALVCWGLDAMVGLAVRRQLFAAGAVAMLALLVLTLGRNADYRSEEAIWRDTAAKRPMNPRAHNNLGEALRRAGRPEAAMAEFRRALELQPNHAYAHANLGVALLAQRKWAEAADHLSRAVAADPDLADARLNLGVALEQLGRPAEAEAQYRAALKIDTAAADARTNLAALLLDRGQGAEAEALLRQALAEAPDLGEAHYQLGRVQEKAGAARAAEQEYREAIRLAPSFAKAHLALGNLLANRGDLAGAESAYQDALRRDADLAGACYALGNLWAGQQRFDVAIEAFERCLRLDPSHALARNNLANCQLVTGRFREAITNYEQVLKVRADDADVQRNLGVAREMARRSR